jgi:hypothetical protein
VLLDYWASSRGLASGFQQHQQQAQQQLLQQQGSQPTRCGALDPEGPQTQQLRAGQHRAMITVPLLLLLQLILLLLVPLSAGSSKARQQSRQRQAQHWTRASAGEGGPRHCAADVQTAAGCY